MMIKIMWGGAGGVTVGVSVGKIAEVPDVHQVNNEIRKSIIINVNQSIIGLL